MSRARVDSSKQATRALELLLLINKLIHPPKPSVAGVIRKAAIPQVMVDTLRHQISRYQQSLPCSFVSP